MPIRLPGKPAIPMAGFPMSGKFQSGGRRPEHRHVRATMGVNMNGVPAAR
ncbi:hypothetical protein [Larkinella soli]|nr:hypothetical protein [Larkinella soli]